MSDAHRVETRTVDGGPTAVGSYGPFTVLIDRPTEIGEPASERAATT